MQVMIKLAMMSLSDEKTEINFDRMTSSNHTQTHSMKKKFFFLINDIMMQKVQSFIVTIMCMNVQTGTILKI